MSEVTIKIEGMKCAGCQENVENALNSVNGVLSVDINLEEGSATINYDPEKTDIDKIKSAVSKAGYKAK
jgi:copper chaperone CopZ